MNENRICKHTVAHVGIRSTLLRMKTSCLCGFSFFRYSSMCFERVPIGFRASRTCAITSAESITWSKKTYNNCEYIMNVTQLTIGNTHRSNKFIPIDSNLYMKSKCHFFLLRQTSKFVWYKISDNQKGFFGLKSNTQQSANWQTKRTTETFKISRLSYFVKFTPDTFRLSSSKYHFGSFIEEARISNNTIFVSGYLVIFNVFLHTLDQAL